MAGWSGRLLTALTLAALGGCAARERTPPGLPADRMMQAVSARRSLLLGGDVGFDDGAVEMGRSDWPAAYRDDYSGETLSYYERYYDVQASPAYNFYWGGGGYTVQQFRSDRFGGYRRY